jgi:hypothetical protein
VEQEKAALCAAFLCDPSGIAATCKLAMYHVEKLRLI